MNVHVEEVRRSVVALIASAGTPTFGSEFVFVREDGEAHAMAMPELIAALGDGRDSMVGVYAGVMKMIETHNDSNPLSIVGLVHTAHIGEKEGKPHLMVVALDDTGDGLMTLFPVKGDVLGEPREGQGFSPQLDPWGYLRNRGTEA